MQNAMIIIAVSKYGPGYNNLPGTLNCARDIQAWADVPSDKSRNYKILAITDATEPVTVRRLQAEIKVFLENNFIDRLVVYFAGHGMVGANSDLQWLLSDIHTDSSEAVDVEAMRRGLQKCNIGGSSPEVVGQLSIISDCCRNVAKEGLNIVGHPIVTRVAENDYLDFDRFASTETGEYSFHITNDKGEHYCLFTDVLLEGLMGNAPSAIKTDHHIHSPAVINNTLKRFLQINVPKRAQAIGVKMRPDIYCDIADPDNVYTKMSSSTRGNTTTDETGAITATISMSSFDSNSRSDNYNSKVVKLEESLERVYGILHKTSDALAPISGVGINNVGLRLSEGMRIRVIDKSKTYDFFDYSTLGESSTRNPETLSDHLFFSAVVGNPGFRLGEQENLVCICEEKPEAISAPISARVAVFQRETHWEIYAVELRGASLAVLSKEQWTFIPNFENTTIYFPSSMPGNVVKLELRGDGWDWSLCDFTNPNKVESLQLQDAQKHADKIRVLKERFPHRSVTAGYLYEFANDYDNVARTAHYMWKNTGSVPFDLALLCAEEVSWNTVNSEEGVFIKATATLPAVEETSKNEQKNANRPYYARSAMNRAENVKLAGISPIHRQGWRFMQYESRLRIPEPILRVCNEVLGGSTTTLTETGMKLYCEAFGFKVIRGGDEITDFAPPLLTR